MTADGTLDQALAYAAEGFRVFRLDVILADREQLDVDYLEYLKEHDVTP